jgi:hypothetical protein
VNDVVVTRIWIAGVMLIMAAYGVITLVGFWRRTAKSLRA